MQIEKLPLKNYSQKKYNVIVRRTDKGAILAKIDDDNINQTDNKVSIRLPIAMVEKFESLISLHIPTFKFSKDAFMYMMSKIWKITNRKNFNGLQKVPLSSIILKHEFGNNYKRYLDWLMFVGMIATDNHYIKSGNKKEGKCKCYGFTEHYKIKESQRYILSDNCITTKILAYRQVFIGNVKDSTMVSHFYDMLVNFKVDIEGATNHLNQLVSSGQLEQHKCDIELDKAKRINGEIDHPAELFISSCNFGRVHTNLTNMSRIVRDGFLTLNGEKVVGIDIRSSQPALFYSLVKDWRNKVTSTIGSNVWNYLFTEPKEEKCDERSRYVNKNNMIIGGTPVYTNNGVDTITSPLGYSTYGSMLHQLDLDLALYKKWLSDDIYLKIASVWSEVDKGRHTTRSNVKKAFLVYLFGQNDKPYCFKMNAIFRKYFPAMHQLCMHLKRDHHSHLAHSLQRIESNLVLKGVCAAVDRELSIDYGTVHDSILVREQDFEKVSLIFNRILKERGIETVALHH